MLLWVSVRIVMMGTNCKWFANRMSSLGKRSLLYFSFPYNTRYMRQEPFCVLDCFQGQTQQTPCRIASYQEYLWPV